MTVMSFHPVKHITTGEGGVVLTNDEKLFKKLKILRSHGIVNTPEEFVYNDMAMQSLASGQQQNANPWYYEQVELGYNYRLTDIQCALGLSQLKRIQEFCNRRREIVGMYNDAFSIINSIQTPYESEDCTANFHLYVILFDWEKIGMNRTQFMMELKNSGILTQVHFIPVYTHPYYQRRFNTKWGDCPKAEQYYKKCLSIPLYPAMSNSDVEKVIKDISALIHKERKITNG
jgi:dTDP-4-amino-4,6-dideoxygalactose transaminase